MRRLLKRLQNEGKRVDIKTFNQTIKTTKEGILEFTFSLKIELVEVKK
jgi:hypothetical protein